MSERLRNQPPYHFTLSIAAPASFWYLKAFPIKQMARYLDYIVYMTYDLHGQWDAGNQWTSEGCPGGNCLRSHVNLTETVTALAMSRWTRTSIHAVPNLLTLHSHKGRRAVKQDIHR